METHLISSPFYVQISTKVAIHSPFLRRPGHWSPEFRYMVNFKPHRRFQSSRTLVSSAMNAAAGHSDDPGKVNWNSWKRKVKELWDISPEPVRCFPWGEALDNFIQLIADLILAVIKYLCVPLLAITSLSEMSYCAHEKKLSLIPFPLIIGFSVAELLRQTALSVSPVLKDLEVPWHLITIAIFFTLVKLPGPYYPYWGRVLIPHFANGGLLRTLWSSFLWFRRPRKTSRTSAPPKQRDNHVAANKQ